jgi:hypothetical protein
VYRKRVKLGRSPIPPTAWVKIQAVLHPEEAELVWTMLNHAAT